MEKISVEAPTKPVVDSTMKRSIRVLHVDDQSGLLKAAKRILEMQGNFQVETASSVKEAMEKMKEKEFDVIVSDYIMPEKNGLEFLKELRERGNKVPFIIFTGKGREEVAIKALNLGADRYLSKIGSPEVVYGELAHSIRKTVKKRRADTALLENEKRYRELTESISDVFFAMNKDFRYTYWNKASERLTGISKKNAIGKSLTELFPDVKGTKVEQFYSDVLRTRQHQTFVNEYQVGDQDYVFEIDAYPTENGLSVFVKDITECEKREERLRASEERYRSLFENAGYVAITFDLKGKVTSINKAAEEYGFKRDEIIGSSMLKLVSKKYWPRLLKDVAQLARGKAVTGVIEVNTPKGKRIAEYSSTPVTIGGSVWAYSQS